MSLAVFAAASGSGNNDCLIPEMRLSLCAEIRASCSDNEPLEACIRQGGVPLHISTLFAIASLQVRVPRSFQRQIVQDVGGSQTLLEVAAVLACPTPGFVADSSNGDERSCVDDGRDIDEGFSVVPVLSRCFISALAAAGAGAFAELVAGGGRREAGCRGVGGTSGDS